MHLMHMNLFQVCFFFSSSYLFKNKINKDKHTLMSSQWFTWCRLCRHGGHAEHVSNWFSMNDKCPIARCSCRCTSIDGIFSSS